MLSEYVQKTSRILINFTTGNHELMLIVSIKYMSFKSYFFQFILIWHKNFMFLKNRVPTLYNFLKNLLSLKIRWRHSLFLIWIVKKKKLRCFCFLFWKIFQNFIRKKSKVLTLYFLFFILFIECQHSIFISRVLDAKKSKVEHRHSLFFCIFILPNTRILKPS